MKKRSKRGFTLVEILVATLILVMVSLCVMMGTATAQNVYRDALFVSESELLADTLSAAMGDVLHYAVYDGVSDGTASFTNDNYGVAKGRFTLKDGQLYMTADDGAIVESDLKRLLGKSAYSGLQIKDFTMSYTDGVFSGSYTIFHPKSTTLSKALSFSYRTLR